MDISYKEAIDHFKSTNEWATSADPSTLPAPDRCRYYLQNRLDRAFAAGWNAAHDEIKRLMTQVGEMEDINSKLRAKIKTQPQHEITK